MSIENIMTEYVVVSKKHFAGIHDSSGIKEFLDLLHERDTYIVLGISKSFGFHGTNTVFCGNGAPE